MNTNYETKYIHTVGRMKEDLKHSLPTYNPVGNEVDYFIKWEAFSREVLTDPVTE